MEIPVTIPEWTWIKVASAVTDGIIIREDTTVYYYRVYKKAGATAPTEPTIGTIPAEAVKIFEQSKYAVISNNTAIDVYIMCANTDNDDDESGKVMVNI